MPAYAYKGMDARGKNTSGIRDAESPRALRTQLKREAIFVTEIEEAGEEKVRGQGLSREVSFTKMFDRVSAQDVAIITRQLSTLLRAGVPLTESLAALVDQSESPRLRSVLAEVRSEVNQGHSFGDSLAQHKHVFSDLYINMVHAGEAAGNLEEVLARLADFMENQAVLKNRIQSAMMYPVLMGAVSIGICSLLMIVVVPKVTQIFADLDKALPWNTQLLIFASNITGSYWWLLIILAVAATYGFKRWKKTPKGKHTWDSFLLKLWVVGPLVRMVAIGRFARTAGTMLASAVPLLQTLDIVKAILGNQILVEAVEDARIAIREGGTLSDPLARSGQFPPVVTRMIAVGERSGQLETMLETMAHAYESEVELKLGRLTSLMEPLMILVMGGIVAFIVFSILMPILDMNEMVG